MLASLTLLGSLALARAAAAATIEQPRSFGHFLGDVLSQRILLGDNESLDAKHLPRADRVGPWFERRSSRIEHDAQGRTWLAIDYQIVNSPRDTQTVSLPALTIASMSGSPLRVPEWAVSISPLVRTDEAGNPHSDILPDHAPARIPIGPIRLQLAVWALAGGAVSVAWLLWVLWRNQRDSRRLPFARAARELSRLGASGADSPEAWIAMHRALNTTAGRVVQGESIQALFERAPQLAPLRSELERFYALSSERFFARATAQPPYRLSVLCQGLRRIEQQQGSAHVA